MLSQHLERERCRRRTGGRGDGGSARRDSAQPAIVVTVATRGLLEVNITGSERRSPCPKTPSRIRESRARDQACGTGIEVDAHRRFGEHVDEGGAEH